MRNVPLAPMEFEGTLEELYARHIVPALPLPSTVEAIHKLLLRYASDPSSVLLLREIRGKERRTEELSEDGTAIRWTDNTPAWAMHRLTFRNDVPTHDNFPQAVMSLPTHIFDASKGGNDETNRAGWYVAHLLQAKPSHLTKHYSDGRYAQALFFRNLHPANHFLVPRCPVAQSFTSKSGVLGFIANQFAERYASIWSELLDVTRAEVSTELPLPPDPLILFSVRAASSATASRAKDSGAIYSYAPPSEVVCYRDCRFAFRRSIIEPLGQDEAFQIDTPEGSYRMTKRQFLNDFANVASAKDYAKGRYHYPSVPRRAEKYRVR